MACFVYILKSLKDSSYYVGSANDLEDRPVLIFLGYFFQGRIHFVEALARFGFQTWPQQRHKQLAKLLALNESNGVLLKVLSLDKLHFF